MNTLVSIADCRANPPRTTFPRIVELFKMFKSTLKQDPAVLHLQGPIAVVGDLHGNSIDLTRILERLGYPPTHSFLFLGDIIDRGPASVETIAIIACLKVLYPSHVYIIRGNHENTEICSNYGFLDECLRRFSVDIYHAATKAFDFLPVAAIINNSVLCVHGGISEDIHSREELESLQPDDLVVSDLLWSDPDSEIDYFVPSPRGRGHHFGEYAFRTFMEECQITKLIRSHEMCTCGYNYPFSEIVPVITIFSSSDYCGAGNSASVAVFGEEGDHESIILFLPLSSDATSKRRPLIPSFTESMEEAAQKVPNADPYLFSASFGVVYA